MIVEDIKQRCSSNCPSGHVLVIQDTTDLNYDHLWGKLKVNDADIGHISGNKSIGFMAHPSLAVDAGSGTPFGLSELLVYERRIGKPSKEERDYESLPIEQKETYKWLLSGQRSKACLKAASQLTLISDRESDIYELLCQLPDERTHVLIRARHKRQIVGGQKVKDILAQQPWHEGLRVKVSGKWKRTAHQAQLQVRWASVELARPVGNRERNEVLAAYPASVRLQVVEIVEKAESVPKGEKPIHWLLWTTHEVETVQQALQIGQWYANRWWIEDLFRIIKDQGFEVDASQFGTGQALKKLVACCLDQAWKVLLLRQERTAQGGHPASLCFTPQEREVLTLLQPRLEGKTPKQRNPHAADSLAWATWLIARLGGWKPADLTKRPPGVITLARGLTAFYARMEGWRAAMDFFHQKSKSGP